MWGLTFGPPSAGFGSLLCGERRATMPGKGGSQLWQLVTILTPQGWPFPMWGLIKVTLFSKLRIWSRENRISGDPPFPSHWIVNAPSWVGVCSGIDSSFDTHMLKAFSYYTCTQFLFPFLNSLNLYYSSLKHEIYMSYAIIKKNLQGFLFPIWCPHLSLPKIGKHQLS